MGEKLHLMGAGPRGGTVYVFHCPGCRCAHPVEVPRWQWDGSMVTPTFSPSLLCNRDSPESRCHSFIEGGKIRFLPYCFHALAGQAVDLPDWEE
jgi:hypothetical protein